MTRGQAALCVLRPEPGRDGGPPGRAGQVRNAKGTIRFAPGVPLPTDLVTKLVKARIAETDASERSG
jgi:hypothetical protein